MELNELIETKLVPRKVHQEDKSDLHLFLNLFARNEIKNLITILQNSIVISFLRDFDKLWQALLIARSMIKLTTINYAELSTTSRLGIRCIENLMRAKFTKEEDPSIEYPIEYRISHDDNNFRIRIEKSGLSAKYVCYLSASSGSGLRIYHNMSSGLDLKKMLVLKIDGQNSLLEQFDLVKILKFMKNVSCDFAFSAKSEDELKGVFYWRQVFRDVQTGTGGFFFRNIVLNCKGLKGKYVGDMLNSCCFKTASIQATGSFMYITLPQDKNILLRKLIFLKQFNSATNQ